MSAAIAWCDQRTGRHRRRSLVLSATHHFRDQLASRVRVSVGRGNDYCSAVAFGIRSCLTERPFDAVGAVLSAVGVSLSRRGSFRRVSTSRPVTSGDWNALPPVSSSTSLSATAAKVALLLTELFRNPDIESFACSRRTSSCAASDGRVIDRLGLFQTERHLRRGQTGDLHCSDAGVPCFLAAAARTGEAVRAEDRYAPGSSYRGRDPGSRSGLVKAASLSARPSLLVPADRPRPRRDADLGYSCAACLPGGEEQGARYRGRRAASLSLGSLFRYRDPRNDPGRTLSRGTVPTLPRRSSPLSPLLGPGIRDSRLPASNPSQAAETVSRASAAARRV